MKRFLAIMLAAMLLLCSSLTAFAEDTNSRANQPPQAQALTHGDFCLPNLFTDGNRFTGMIDLGDCGIADPWRDLSLGWRSLKHNSDGHWGARYPEIDPDDLFRAAGVPKDEQRLRYYLLLDELF